MPDLLPHLRRDLHALECLVEHCRAAGSAFADLVDGDIAALAERIVVAEKAAGIEESAQ